ncbi:ComF family protein [Microbacterium lacticum]
MAPVVERRVARGVAVTAGGAYDGVLARVLSAFKDEGRMALAAPLADLLRAALEAAEWAGEPVVTVPTTRAAFVRRGFRPVDVLAREAGAEVARILVARGRRADQRGLNRVQRAANLADGFGVRGRPAARSGVFLVDDVVTTGATIAAARGALRSAEIEVRGVAVVASTPRRKYTAPGA